MKSGFCEDCINFVYDENDEMYVCLADFDEDEIYKFETNGCPYFRSGDDYELARKQ